MKQKHAIGLAINGNEIRAAFLTLNRGKACIHALESTTLDGPLENIQDSNNNQGSLNDLEKAFDIKDPQYNTEEKSDESPEQSSHNKNISLVYSLVDRFQHIKSNVAVNTPVLTVKYDVLESETLPKDKNFKKKLKEKIDIWGNDNGEVRRTNYKPISEGKMLQIDYEFHPPIIDLIDEVNQFRAGNMHLVLMDTNELALADLVVEIYKFKKDETTAIVYIEQDFSRVIFLKGQKIYHITPIIHKGSMSKDVLEVIYSRILFAQDQHFIPELNKILVAGHSSKLKAKYYFRQKFPNAITGYLNSKKIQSKLRFKDRGLLFSRYAIPIALAWKALQKRVISSKTTNLLPEYIVDRQKMPKLAFHGYLLLFLLPLTAFSFTWMLIAKNMEIRNVHRNINIMKTQLENNKSLTNRVESFDGQINELDRKIALVDSFKKGYDEPIEFLNSLSHSVRQTGDIWLNDFTKQSNNVKINGMSKHRDKIPILATSLGGANLNKVTRTELYGTKLYSFQLDTKIENHKSSKSSNAILMAGNNGAVDSKSQVALPDNLSSKDISPQLDTRQDRKMESQNGGLKRTPKESLSQNATSQNLGHDSQQRSTKVQSDYKYGLQLGFFSSYKEAAKESKKYSNKGYHVVISNLSSSSTGNEHLTLIVGAYDNLHEAQKLSKLFSNKSNIENKVVKYKMPNNQ